MRCQLHLDVEAASICVSCGRALCRDCQQTTRDERMICGLPQCEEFVKRQKAVQFAVRQTCANNAEAQSTQARLYRGLGAVLYLLGAGLIIPGVFANAFAFRGFANVDFGLILFILLGAVCLFAGWIVMQVPAKLVAQARNWEDISREFDEGRTDDKSLRGRDSIAPPL